MPDFVRTARPLTGFIRLMTVCCALIMAGCASWFGRESVYQNELVNHYNKLAKDVAKLEPKIQHETSAVSIGEARELIPPKIENRWALSLAEAIRIALQNNTIIRQNAQFLSPNDPVMQNPDGVPSIYDSLIQNKGVLFGSRGTDAALSDFDPRLTTTLKSGNDLTVDNLSNTLVPGQVPPGNILNNDYTQVQAKVEQQLLGGGTFSVFQNWNRSLSNQPDLLYTNAFTGVFGAEYRQPLWAGSGRTYTSIAGPIGQRARGFSNVSQGIVIAHINKRLSEIDLQENLQNLVREIGDLYWDLYQNYEDYESEQAMANVAEKLWKTISRRRDSESPIEIVQAEAAYYEAKSREETALSNLYITESQLRRLMNVPLDDSRLIYPSDIPREDEMRLNRAMCLYEALVNRIELTRQKTNLQSLHLQLCAAKKLVAPRLDFVSEYALNGFGHNFVSANSDPFSSAAGNLYSGRETSWSAGFEYSIPLWLRQEKAQVKQLELKIIKAKQALGTQEDDIARQLNVVLIKINRAQKIAKTHQSRMQATKRQVAVARSITSEGVKNSDVYLKALTNYTQSRVAYSRSVTEYNKSLRDLLFRIGRLLPADGISVVGADGVPVLSPLNTEAPFDDLLKPSGPTETVPPRPSPPGSDPEEIDEPKELDEKPDDRLNPNTWPKPKKAPPTAGVEGNAVAPASFLRSLGVTDTEFSMPRPIANEDEEEDLMLMPEQPMIGSEIENSTDLPPLP